MSVIEKRKKKKMCMKKELTFRMIRVSSFAFEDRGRSMPHQAFALALPKICMHLTSDARLYIYYRSVLNLSNSTYPSAMLV